MNSTTTSTIWPLTHDLPENVRWAMIELLNRALADAIDLGLQAKQAHWNVKGLQFVSLHALFDEAAAAMAELADEFAERAVALGGIAHGTVQTVSAGTRLDAYSPNLLTGADHLDAVDAALAHLAQSARSAIDTATAEGDATTADVFTQASRTLDTLRWKLAAHREPGSAP